jgi:hypothetical protein
MKNETMGEFYSKHKARILKIQTVPHAKTLIEFWECNYEKKIQDYHDFAYFVQNETLKKPLEPRNALAGGRTNAFMLHHVGKIGYVDFTSLSVYSKEWSLPYMSSKNHNGKFRFLGKLYRINFL